MGIASKWQIKIYFNYLYMINQQKHYSKKKTAKTSDHK